MAQLFLPKADLKAIIRQRREQGLDRFDEVWNGVYVMSPEPTNEHQDLAGFLYFAIRDGLGNRSGAKVFPAVNLTDRDAKWTKNFRCPDLSVFLKGNPAEDRETHWFGGPDFAVEILSKGDRSRRKFEFYAKVGVRELLLVDRSPWRLELYRNVEGVMTLAGSVALGASGRILNEVLPVSFRLLESTEGPKLEVTQTDDGRVWLT